MKTSPMKFLSELTAERVDDAKPDDAPVLIQIIKENGRNNALSLLSLMIKELQQWFNVKNNISNEQITLIAEVVLEDKALYDLTLGNIKACFRKQMAEAKLYDRLDGNIIIQWLKDFKRDLVEQTVANNDNLGNVVKRSNQTCTFDAWLAKTKEKAEQGDEEAVQRMKDYAEFMERVKNTPTREQERKKELEFYKFRMEYERNRRKRRD